jgi:eight-cysteine-cluster-containing protein
MGKVRTAVWACVVLVMSACGSMDGVAPGSRLPTSILEYHDTYVVSHSDPNHDRFELPEAPGECSQEMDCSTAGCAGEVCTAAANALDVVTTCDEIHPGQHFSCGCVNTRCRWSTGDTPP